MTMLTEKHPDFDALWAHGAAFHHLRSPRLTMHGPLAVIFEPLASGMNPIHAVPKELCEKEVDRRLAVDETAPIPQAPGMATALCHAKEAFGALRR